MRNRFAFLLALLLPLFLQSQIISLSPSSANPDQLVSLIFDANEGNSELSGADKVYIHHGIVLSSPDGTDWNYVQGNWGQDDGIGEMISLGDDKWQIDFAPTLREYFGAADGENIFRISAVFRSADGATKGTIDPGEYSWGTVLANQDNYINLNVANFVGFDAPQGAETFLNDGESVEIIANASSEVTSMQLLIDEGNGYEEVFSSNSGTSITYAYYPTESSLVSFKLIAEINGEDLESIKEHNVIVITPSEIAALPAGARAGINYNSNDQTKVTLVLEAPEKDYAHVVGDFSNWAVLAENQMKKTPDGEFLWAEITDLEPLQPYVFQYWVEDDVKIGDPYADQAADPWNDGYIDDETYPNVPEYTRTDLQYATVFQTGQTEYQWASSEDSWERPDGDHLVIYELLVRDFLASHSFQDLIDTLPYLKNLGIDALELLPWNEFEGNESWGYNPAYFFAPDKYYGTKDDLKAFIEAAHANGLAVIMDVVLNHAFGQNPMVKMYFEGGKPANDNPWFNRDHVGQYQWGYDFDHESSYTQAFVDRVNQYWIEEYHVDGYRFDFTKGFTNFAPGGSVDGFDQSRIDIIKRMVDRIRDVDEETYVILEHWAPANEEQILGDYGLKMWRNRSYDYVPAITGNISGNFNSMDVETHVSFFNSHDERRIAEHALVEGASKDGYNVKDEQIMFERAKMTAAFNYLYPGPKMMWQFDELGYDINIDFNGRTGNKPLPWGDESLQYYEDPLRQHIYTAYQEILRIRKIFGAENLSNAGTSHKQSGAARRLMFSMPGNDLVVLGNFGVEHNTVSGSFPQNGTWYDYFSGDSITVVSGNDLIDLEAGEWHIYTSEKISEGFPGVVEVYQNPVTINPNPFTKSTEITITFDAKKASKNGTDGLIGADKVYFHSGVVSESPDSEILENIVGNLTDDGVGEMTSLGDDLWEITITPSEYYSIDVNTDIFRLGMYFRDAENENEGKGFRDATIFFQVDSDKPFITVDPPAFKVDEEITITFNALKGNGELVGQEKVYMHSGIDLSETETPWISGWDNTVGNWGQDDGVGEMNAVDGQSDQWEISFVPETYYGLTNDDIVRWICAVFRSADGSIKGTGMPGPILNGVIHSNQDFFVRNLFVVNADETEIEELITYIYPNPAQAQINLELQGFYGDVTIEIYDTEGKNLHRTSTRVSNTGNVVQPIDISQIQKGVFVVKLSSNKGIITKQFVKL
ncbi:alpha-amylase family glycosyl hydrolase [Saprospiraceae bacterium]|nr:alpha-amylase family glycosyl hydrolase [Saprospiraceae bacterium]